MQVQHKAAVAPLAALKAVDDQPGTFVGYASTFGNVDRAGESVQAGAFTATISAAEERRKATGGRYLWPILWQHDTTQPIGGWVAADQDTHGLKLTGELDIDVPEGKRAYNAIKRGYVDSLSIGYYVRQDGWEKGVRLLKDLDLVEVSIVTQPANPQALVGAVKSADFATLDAANAGYALAGELRQKFDTLMAALGGCCCDDALPDTAAKMGAVSQSLMQFAADCEQCCGAALTKAEAAGVPLRLPMPMPMGEMADPAEPEQKAGRTLSAANVAKLGAALQALSDAMATVQEMIDSAAPKPAEDEAPAEDSGSGKTLDAAALTRKARLTLLATELESVAD